MWNVGTIFRAGICELKTGTQPHTALLHGSTNSCSSSGRRKF
jgi:hypothetical protein